jgi:hypothetical protein
VVGLLVCSYVAVEDVIDLRLVDRVVGCIDRPLAKQRVVRIDLSRYLFGLSEPPDNSTSPDLPPINPTLFSELDELLAGSLGRTVETFGDVACRHDRTLDVVDRCDDPIERDCLDILA